MPPVYGNLSRRALLGAAAALPSSVAVASAMADPLLAKGELPHFKCTQFVRSAAGLAPEAMLDHWRQHRAPLLRRLPGLTGLAFNTVNRGRSPDATYDAVIELWFESAAAYANATEAADPGLIEALATGRDKFIQPDFLGMFSREVIVRPVPPQAGQPRAKRIGLVGRQPGMTRDHFFKDWIGEHAPEANRQPGLEGYLLNLRTHDRYIDYPWDGYAALWWTDWDAFEEGSRAIRSTVGARLGFFYSHLLLYLDEHEEIPPPGRDAVRV